MSENHLPPMASDEDLVAFLDGELGAAGRSRVLEALASDESTAIRLQQLEAGMAPLTQAMDTLLDQAPNERMTARLSDLLSKAQRPKNSGKRLWRRYAGLAAAALILLAAGAAIDRSFDFIGKTPGVEETDDTEADWRKAVAGYFSLYTNETFAAAASAGPAANGTLDRVGNRIGLQISANDVALPGMQFAGAVLFSYDGMPLAQIAYLDPQSGPMAFCIIANGEADGPPQLERRDDINVVHWAKDKHGFMLIGRASPDRLQKYAELLSQRI